jgi:hypothetical protein
MAFPETGYVGYGKIENFTQIKQNLNLTKWKIAPES